MRDQTCRVFLESQLDSIQPAHGNDRDKTRAVHLGLKPTTTNRCRASSSGQDPGRILRLGTSIHNGQHVASLGEEALPGPQRGPWMDRNRGSESLGVIKRVEYIVPHEVATHVGERVFRGETGKERLGLKPRLAMPRVRAQSLKRSSAGSDLPGRRKGWTTNTGPAADTSRLSRSRSSSVDER